MCVFETYTFIYIYIYIFHIIIYIYIYIPAIVLEQVVVPRYVLDGLGWQADVLAELDDSGEVPRGLLPLGND